MKFHPAAQILTWCVLVVSLQTMSLGILLVTAGFILLGAYAISRHKFTQLVRRTRWVMLSLILIYAYCTPGQPLSVSIGILSPSIDGLVDGTLQLTRLLAALAGLAILLDHMHRQQLIAGLFTLFAPLQLIGLPPERLAVRLALTLHYAEVALLREKYVWHEDLDSLFDRPGESNGGSAIELPVIRFLISDVLLLGCAFVLLAVTMQ